MSSISFLRVSLIVDPASGRYSNLTSCRQIGKVPHAFVSGHSLATPSAATHWERWENVVTGHRAVVRPPIGDACIPVAPFFMRGGWP